jgi:syntaxin 1B/2/3
MKNLFSSSRKRGGAGGEAVASLDRFFKDVDSTGIEDELRDLERIQSSLHDRNEAGKSLCDASAVRALRSRMDADVSAAISKAKAVKLCLESLDRANAANRSLPECGPGSSTDRARTAVVAGLRKKLRDSMESFSSLRARVASDHRDTVARRYFTVTGSQPDEKTLDDLVETGDGERFLQRAIAEQQGRGEVVGLVAEIQERHGGVAQLERNLLELHQVFYDMAVLVEVQEEPLVNIKGNLDRARSYLDEGREELQVARKYKKRSRKWICIVIGIGILVIVVAGVVLLIVL